MAITKYGMATVAALIGNDTSAGTTDYDHVGVGTTATAPTINDSDLGAQVGLRQAAVGTNRTTTLADDTLRLVHDYFSFSSAYAIAEVGVFNSATTAGSSMLSRSTFSAINVSSTVTIKVTVDVVVSDATA